MLNWIEKRNQLEAIGITDYDKLEEQFVKYAGGFAERKGFSYKTLREAGVPASVLKKAGIQ